LEVEVFVVENETQDKPELLVIAEHKKQALNSTLDILAKEIVFGGSAALEEHDQKIIVYRPNEKQQVYSLRPLGGRIIVVRISEIITNL